MNQAELEAKLAELIALPQESEWVEFKDSYAEPQLIGEYLSALSNSAALHRQPHGYIVWGVENGSHDIIGTHFKPRQTKGAGNEDLEPWLARLLPISEFEARNLKAKNLVEGRRPNLYVSAKIARVTDTVADYLKRRGIDKGYCRHMVLEFLGKQAEASRQEIDGLLASKLCDALDETQKKNFITNLLQEMRREGTLVVEGTTRWAKWRLP